MALYLFQFYIYIFSYLINFNRQSQNIDRQDKIMIKRKHSQKQQKHHNHSINQPHHNQPSFTPHPRYKYNIHPQNPSSHKKESLMRDSHYSIKDLNRQYRPDETLKYNKYNSSLLDSRNMMIDHTALNRFGYGSNMTKIDKPQNKQHYSSQQQDIKIRILQDYKHHNKRSINSTNDQQQSIIQNKDDRSILYNRGFIDNNSRQRISSTNIEKTKQKGKIRLNNNKDERRQKQKQNINKSLKSSSFCYDTKKFIGLNDTKKEMKLYQNMQSVHHIKHSRKRGQSIFNKQSNIQKGQYILTQRKYTDNHQKTTSNSHNKTSLINIPQIQHSIKLQKRQMIRLSPQKTIIKQNKQKIQICLSEIDHFNNRVNSKISQLINMVKQSKIKDKYNNNNKKIIVRRQEDNIS